MALRPACAHVSSAARTRLGRHLGTTTGMPWTTATPRHHGGDTLVSPATGLRGALSGVETATQHRQAREPLEPPHERREPRVLGLLDSVQAHQYMREQSHGSPPILGVWSKRPERRRARAALCGLYGSAVWRLSLALPVRAVRMLCHAQRVVGASIHCRYPARDGVAMRPRPSGSQRHRKARGR